MEVGGFAISGVHVYVCVHVLASLLLRLFLCRRMLSVCVVQHLGPEISRDDSGFLCCASGAQ